jgi:hypothetical protein
MPQPEKATPLKTIRLRLFTGDLSACLRPERLQPKERPNFWRDWIAWERLSGEPPPAALRLAASTSLVDGQPQGGPAGDGLPEALQRAWQRLIELRLDSLKRKLG